MTRLLPRRAGMAWLASAIFLSTIASAQQKGQVVLPNRGYDVNREVSVQGTVVRFVENSPVAPFGAHVTVHSSSGALDVQLGDGRLLESNHFTLAAGDEIRVVGENVTLATGPQFMARVIQKGNQAVAVRSTRGFPLRPAASKSSGQAGAR